VPSEASPSRAVRPAEIPGLTGGRGLACAGVVVVHVLGLAAATTPAARALAPLANACVTFFFALSGFLLGRPFLAAILDRRIDGPARPPLRRYARQRVLRIFPAYVVIFLVADFALRAVYVGNAVVVQRPHSAIGSGRITDPLRLLEQLTLTHDFLPGQLQSGINPSWSLTTEVCFYALLPLLAAGGYGLVRRGIAPLRAAVRLPVLLIGVGLLAKAVDVMGQVRSGLDTTAAQFGPRPLAVFSRSVLVAADAFGWGMAAALVYCVVRRRRRWLAPIAGAVALAAGGAGWSVADAHYVLAQAAFALASGALLVTATGRDGSGRPAALGRAMDWAPFHFLGRISYSLYLWHYPVLLVALRSGWAGPPTPAGSVRSLAVVFAVAVGLATLTYALIERPALRWGARRSAAVTLSSAAAPVPSAAVPL